MRYDLLGMQLQIFENVEKNILEEWPLFLKSHQKNIILNGHIEYKL